ncbi:hypothetical protein SUGI_0745390 [Cryptomeria japonica]|nr:hypothetical protein SUGI_0745390 [Cryptomeria japonica]
MAVRVCFKAVCLCGLEEYDDQLKWLFVVGEETLLRTIKKVMGEDFYTGSHIHDGLVLERFFTMVAQGTSKIYKAVRVANKLLHERYKEGVRTAIQAIETDPEDGYIADVFDEKVVGKGQRVAQALGIYKE